MAVDAAHLQHPGVHHARAQHLDPAGALAHAAARALAVRAGQIHLGGRLREGEEGRAEAGLDALAVHLAGELVQRALQVAHGDVLVDHQALHLVEHRAVGGVGLVGAVHPARADHADGRLAGGHDAGLHRGGVGAQHDVVIHVERILRIAGGMVLGQVQKLEVVVVILHLRALHHLVAHAHEDVHHLRKRDVHRVQRAGAASGAGQGHVDGLRLQARGLFLGGQLPGALLQFFLQRGAHVVHQLAHLRPLLRRQLAHAAQKAGQFALLAQHGHADLLQRGAGLGLVDVHEHPLADFPKHLFHPIFTPQPVFCGSGTGHKKASSPQGAKPHCSAVPPKFTGPCRSLIVITGNEPVPAYWAAPFSREAPE